MKDEKGNIAPDSENRRSFLFRAAQVFSAFVFGVTAGPRLAHACAGCCGLCEDNTGFNPSECACVWDWLCPDNQQQGKTCRWYKCEECIGSFENGCTQEWCDNPVSDGNPCVTCGSHVIKSRATQTGQQVPNCTPD